MMSVRAINNAVRKCKYLYLVRFGMGGNVRIMDSRTRKGVMEIKSLNTGRWIEVTSDDRIEERP